MIPSTESVFYYDRSDQLRFKQITVSRYGVFGVGPPIGPAGDCLRSLHSVYHLPTHLLLVPWASLSLSVMVAEAEMLDSVTHHARAWSSGEPGRLRRDKRVRAVIEPLWDRLRRHESCFLLPVEDVNLP